ncbi:hypothetical protein HHI36_021870 [Cryptolaemus montrouzieri]|uniref:Uncharacterized protein n=1 Tax=Cryptolaemus montrouzieri TaxID=559131 RepID=A0ABD2MY64_9CUCU
MNLMHAIGCRKTFKEPYRIGQNTATCIDNIFTNINIVNGTTTELHISDHLAQILNFSIAAIEHEKRRETIMSRDITGHNTPLLQEDLH